MGIYRTSPKGCCLYPYVYPYEKRAAWPAGMCVALTLRHASGSAERLRRLRFLGRCVQQRA
jgi:hypothetical protein